MRVYGGAGELECGAFLVYGERQRWGVWEGKEENFSPRNESWQSRELMVKPV